MENIDLVNPDCEDIILISEDYCLDKSFDIIKQNFDVLVNKLDNKQKEVDLYKIIKEKYNKNKQKYEKFLTFVNQFSANLIDVWYVFEKYKPIWSIINTPMEVMYPTIIPLENWGQFDSKSGNLVRTAASNQTVDNIVTWANAKFKYSLYGIYENLNVRVYVDTRMPFNFSFNAKYKEECIASGGTKTVCCKGCSLANFNKGCNRLGKKGEHVCGNMYDYCPAAKHSNNCATGSCLGSGGKEMKVNKTITLPEDTYLLGNNLLELKLNKDTQLWQTI